jgi:ABC-2 type transport system ATP-binding protein
LQGNDVMEVVDQVKEDGLFKATLRLRTKASSNDFIRYLAERVAIHSFNEKLPSMEEIFIGAVRRVKP